MRNLFSINSSGEVEILPQAWAFEKFRAIRDKYEEPGIAAVELCLVYFAADYRSNFLSIKTLEERIVKIKNNLYLHRKIRIDEVTKEAIKFYIKEQDTIKVKLIRSVTSSVSKAIDTIEGFSMEDLKDIKDLVDITAKLPTMLQSLEELDAFVKKEEKMAEGVVGSGDKGIYEDG